MKIRAKLMSPPEEFERREKKRRVLRLDIAISTGDQGIDATVHDLSPSGLRIETDGKLDVGEQLLIELPDEQTVEASVVWNSDRSYGCRFLAPIAQRVIGTVVLQAPFVVPTTNPSYRIDEFELESGLDVDRLARWYADFEQRQASSGEQLIGFRKIDEHIVALISRLN